MKIFRYESPVMQFLSHVGDLIVLNLLWLVFSLPIITGGASTAALYRCVLNIYNDTPAGIKTFFTAFKSNFKQGTQLLLVCLCGTAIICASLWFLLYYEGEISCIIRLLPLAPSVLIMTSIGYLFPLQAQFDSPVRIIVRNSVYLMAAHFPTGFLVLMINMIPAIILFFDTVLFLKTGVIWLVIGVALSALANTYFLQKVFRKYINKENIEGTA